jgi:hypothetical protein
MKSSTFCDIKPCLVKSTDVSEVYIASNLTAEVRAKQETSMKNAMQESVIERDPQVGSICQVQGSNLGLMTNYSEVFHDSP